MAFAARFKLILKKKGKNDGDNSARQRHTHVRVKATKLAESDKVRQCPRLGVQRTKLHRRHTTPQTHNIHPAAPHQAHTHTCSTTKLPHNPHHVLCSTHAPRTRISLIMPRIGLVHSIQQFRSVPARYVYSNYFRKYRILYSTIPSAFPRWCTSTHPLVPR